MFREQKVTEMEASIAKKIFLLMNPPYSLMKSTFLWAGLHCWEKWVHQSHPVLRVQFITAAVRWSQSRKAVKVFYSAGAGVSTWKVRTSFTKTLQLPLQFFIILLFLFWNWRYTARQLGSKEWIWVHISIVGAPERNTLKRQPILQQPV